MNTYQVMRTHTSPYHGRDFLTQEKEIVESLLGTKYTSFSTASELPTILLTNTHTKLESIPKRILALTKLIIHSNSGYDNYGDSHQLWKNIPVVIGHSIRAQGVAEYCLAAVLEGLVKLPQHLVWNRERKWERNLLKETDVWIFGYGHIGKIVADSLAQIGMKITVVDPFIENCRYRWLKKWQEGEVEKAKVIISVMGLNRTNYHLFNQDFFSSIARDVIFINPARGPLVDEDSLQSYLMTHPESFAFLDVFETEPFDEKWQGFPRVWKTSHIAGVDNSLDQRILAFEHGVLENFLLKNESDFFNIYKNELLQNKWIQGELI